jgi:hypothetical protein
MTAMKTAAVLLSLSSLGAGQRAGSHVARGAPVAHDRVPVGNLFSAEQHWDVADESSKQSANVSDSKQKQTPLLTYWWMLPVSCLVATTALSLGIGGAAMFGPIFVVAFPLVGVPTLSVADAFGVALLTELAGFSSGLWGYMRNGLVDHRLCVPLVVFGVPPAVAGALLKKSVPGWALEISYSCTMLALIIILAWERSVHHL